MSTPRKPAQKAGEEKDTEKAGAKNPETETAKETGNAENNLKGTEGELKISENSGEGKVFEKPQAPETEKAGDTDTKETKAEGGDIAQWDNVAEVAEKKVKLVKVKFIKAHTFYIGTDRIEAKPNDIKMVEPHTANKLLSRQIAYILG